MLGSEVVVVVSDGQLGTYHVRIEVGILRSNKYLS